MNILVMGGTRFFGVHLVKSLIRQGHQVTIATRGNVSDDFGTLVNRITVDRSNPEAMAAAFCGKHYDIICDNIAYSSLDVKYLLDQVTCDRYLLTSSASVYPELTLDIKEGDFDPFSHPLIWCTREEYSYDEIKRQAECALFQKYAGISAVAVRFPYVIGEDDYTNRLFFYVEHVMREIPMYIDNLEAETAFIHSTQAGAFLAWLTTGELTGPVNAAGNNVITLSQIIRYVEERTGRKAILSDQGEPGPYNSENTAFSLNTNKAESFGYSFGKLDDWIYQLLDTYIHRISAESHGRE